jgi:hypothetical protein
VWISNVSVEGGILDGYNQSFDPGLNVIIGARGTGKSSVIELIRFCLNAKPYSETAAQAAREHALGILGDGKVVLELKDRSGFITVTRTANDEQPEADGEFVHPFIFSQAEIETVGLRAQSRLRLIDGFLNEDYIHRRKMDQIRSEIRSITSQIRELKREIGSLSERTDPLYELEAKLDRLNRETQENSQLHAELAAEREELAVLSPELTSGRVKIEGYERFISNMSDWGKSLERVVQALPSTDIFPSEAGEDNFKDQARRFLGDASMLIATAETKVSEIRSLAVANLRYAQERRTILENHARDIRQRIEAKQHGASRADRIKSDLAQEISLIRSVVELVNVRSESVKVLIEQRDDLLKSLENHIALRSSGRARMAVYLTEMLGPNIRIKLKPFAQTDEYESALLNALRGSGIRYKELIPRIVATLSPRELASTAEVGDFMFLAHQLNISEERAWRLCDALASEEGGNLFVVHVDDDVGIELLDNSDYKGIDFLSMGQKCTAILPIILQHAERTIILDQPEDHLDNAFVVNTLVRSIRDRENAAQTIIATHNPNIPVLGNAASVKVMESNGKRCFVGAAGEMFSPPIVAAITSLMEGGKEAFALRSRFYSENSPNG